MMRSFEFRFEALLRLRRSERDIAAAAVGQAVAEIRQIEQQSATVTRERKALRARTTASLHGQLSVDELIQHGRYDAQLQAHQQTLEQRQAESIAKHDECRQRLIAAEVEVKRCEKLCQRDRVLYDAEQRRLEQLEADDAVAARALGGWSSPGPLAP